MRCFDKNHQFFTIFLAALVLYLASCDSKASLKTVSNANKLSKSDNNNSQDSFFGVIIPYSATKLFAPKNSWRLLWSSSSSDGIKLMEILKEGKKVSKGEKIAWFKFSGKDQLARIKRDVRSKEAKRDKELHEIKQGIDYLEREWENRKLRSQKAQVALKKAANLARLKLKLAKIKARLALIKEKKAYQRIDAERQYYNDIKKIWEEHIDKAKFEIERYHAVKNRYVLTSPHDGIIHYAYNPWKRRKVEKGDGMQSGRHVLSVARDEKIAVEIYIPERLYGNLKIGQTMRIAIAATGASHEITLREISSFPQEIGFLRKNKSLPNAREMAYVGIADFKAIPDDLRSGNEVEVLMP